MEMRGVEPLSENPITKTSPITVGLQNSRFIMQTDTHYEAVAS